MSFLRENVEFDFSQTVIPDDVPLMGALSLLSGKAKDADQDEDGADDREGEEG